VTVFPIQTKPQDVLLCVVYHQKKMRPDEHKAKDSRRYQARKKKQGDETASQVAEARRKAARDKGLGVNAIQRRNGEFVETEEEKEARKKVQAKFAKRKIQSNVERYKEETEQGYLCVYFENGE
jgi:hypothetical protein